MRHHILLLCLLVLLLTGCHRTTTVILPPETEEATLQTQPSDDTSEPGTFTEPTQEATTQPATEPVPTPATHPESTPVTEPTVEPSAEPPTEPTVEPSAEPPMEPTVEPSAEPPMEPTVEPSAEPTTKPATEPSAPPATVPATEPSTEPEKPDVYDISGHRIGSLERTILTELNKRRESEGLSPLSTDDTLCALAAIRAYECSQNASHTRPDGRDWFTVLKDYGYTGWGKRGENRLYASQSYTASQLVDTWMSSVAHRELILSPDFSFVGVGVCKSNGQIYISAIFTG